MAELNVGSKEQYIMAELYLWLLSGETTSFFWKKAQYIFYIMYTRKMGRNS